MKHIAYAGRARGGTIEIESLDEAIRDCLRRAPKSKPDPECICGGPLVLDQPGGEHECAWCGRRAWL